LDTSKVDTETKRLLHVGLTVSDLDRSITFYRDVVGMTLLSEYSGHNDWFDELTSNPGAELKAAHLRLGSYELQLLEYLVGGAEPPAPIAHNRVASPHMCFLVSDVDAKFNEVSQRGDVKITSAITKIVAGARSFYTEDPDGLPVEFVEMPSRASDKSL